MKEKWKKAQGAIRILLFAIISVVFGFGVYRWNAQSLTGNIMPMPFGIGVGVVMSGSMEPEISIDDVIVVIASKEYNVDDVVVFQQRNMLVVHKIIAKDGDTVTTQGTANDTADPPMDISNIKGKVLFHIDGLGAAVTWIKSPMGTVCFLALAATFLIWSYTSENKEKEEKNDTIEQIKREIEQLKGASVTEEDGALENGETISKEEKTE